MFMCCLFLGEKRKHINKIPRKSQESAGTVLGQSRETFVQAFSCLFFAPDRIVPFGCDSDADSNRAMRTARETSKTQTLRKKGLCLSSTLVVRNRS